MYDVAACALWQSLYRSDDVADGYIVGAAQYGAAYCGADVVCVCAWRYYYWMDVHQVAPGANGADGV